MNSEDNKFYQFDDEEIKLDRRKRKNGRFSRYVIAGLIAGGATTAILAASVLILSKKPTSQTQKETISAAIETTAAETTSTTATETGDNKLTISKSPSVESYTSSETYASTIFFGDTFVEGLKSSDIISSDQIYTATSFPTTKASKYIADLAKEKPKRVVFSFALSDQAEGLSDINTAKNFENMVTELRKELQDVELVYFSALPVTNTYSKNHGISNESIDSCNKEIAARAARLNVKYIDISTVFTNSDGSLNSKYTSDGYEIDKDYYPFTLNEAATLIK